MKSKFLKALSVVALLGVGVIGTVACSNGESEDTTKTIVAEDDVTTINIGETVQLSVKNATGNITWKSKNTKIATVDNGLVTGVSDGEVDITAKVDDQTLTFKITVVDPEAGVSGKVIISEDLPNEIVIGTDNALDLDTNNYVSVTKVNRWTLTTESETVQIDGHKIIGVDYGPFLVTLKAGSTRRAIEGHVVSSEKVKFNKFIDSIENNFTVSNAITGPAFVTKDYYANFEESSKSTATFTGAITNSNDGYSYPLEVTMPLTDVDFDYDNASLTMQPGYGRSPSDYGYDYFNVDGNMSSSNFVEILSNGESSGAYLLEDKESGDYDTVLSLWYDRIAPGSFYYFNALVKQTTGNEIGGIVAMLGNDETFASFIPVDTEGQMVYQCTVGTQKVSLMLQISSVGTTSIKAAEDWLKNPTIPEKLDISDLNTFLTNVVTTKSYTLEGKAGWITSTGATASCPSGFKLDGTEVLPAFETISYVNENAVYNKITSANSFYDVGLTNPSAGEISLSITKNGTFYSVAGTSSNGVDSLGEPVASTEENTITDIWQRGSTLTAGSLLLDPKEDGNTLLSMGSFYDKTTDENGTTYSYNLYGPDSQYGLGQYWLGLQGFSNLLVNYTLGYITTLWFGIQGWSFDGAEMFYSLNTEKTELTYTMRLNVGSNTYYSFGWTIKNVGTDAMPEAAKTIIENL